MKKLLAIAALLLFIQPAQADEYVPINNHIVSIGSASASSTTPTAVGINVLRLVCTVNCYVAIAASGEAVYAATPTVVEVTSQYLPANVPEYFRIGSRSKVAVIKVSSSGSLLITELSK